MNDGGEVVPPIPDDPDPILSAEEVALWVKTAPVTTEIGASHEALRARVEELTDALTALVDASGQDEIVRALNHARAVLGATDE